MEHACEKCGTMVDDGVPFCPNCNAPQIRVSALANRPATAPLEPGTPGDVQPPAEPIHGGAFPQFAPAPAMVQWQHAWPAAALAGLLLAVALRIPLAVPFLLMAGAGAFTVALYARRTPAAMTKRAGARVGALGGVLGFVMTTLLLAMEVAASRGGMVSMLRAALAAQLARNPDPRAQEIIERLSTPGGLAFIMAIGLAMMLVVVVLCAAAGGAIAGSILAKRERK